MTNIYVFWKKTSDPPVPWIRLTRTNEYLRFNSNIVNHWTQIGATTHTHTSASVTVENSIHSNEQKSITGYSSNLPIMGIHNDHSVTTYLVENSNNNNPIGWGLDIIFMDMATWENSVRSFPEGSIIMSNGVLINAGLERYSLADGKYIVHTTPETTVGTYTSQGHTINGSLDAVSGDVSIYAYADQQYPYKVGDRALNHEHTFNILSEYKYVEPKNLITRLYRALYNTSVAIADSVVFVDGSVSDNWEILTSWANGSLKAGNSDPILSGSDTHTQTFSGNSSTYDGTDVFSLSNYVSNYDSHYHPISGTLHAASHVPLSRYIVPARLLNTLKKDRERVMVIVT